MRSSSRDQASWAAWTTRRTCWSADALRRKPRSLGGSLLSRPSSTHSRRPWTSDSWTLHRQTSRDTGR